MNSFGRLAVRSVVSGVIAGLIIGIILFIVSALIPTVQLPAAVVGFWAGVAVALLSFLFGLDGTSRPRV